jgi:hypothetical protein
MADVARHVADYNQVLGLDEGDCVISWLPLYHDMGFIACFLMPVLTGARIVMVDPMTWVRRPQLLFELIDKHRGTVCFMPNFGFQVMATRARTGGLDLSSMRRWVSAGEPTRPDTMERFRIATGTTADAICNLYGTAENIFAVTQSDGLRTRRIDGAEVVSCGPPIPSTSLKIVAGEIFARSPYSLQHYEGGVSVVDAEGYYATGDLGEIIDGELYVFGRKHDVLIQAGRKFVLSDLDHEIGQAVEESAGRICVIDEYNELIGTDQPVCLIEHERFWVKMRDQALIGAVKDRIGIEVAKVEFVPPAFLTKTSSGKIARGRVRECFRQLETYRRQAPAIVRPDRRELRDHLGELFPDLLPDVPFREQLDSLGLINLAILFEKFGVPAAPEATIASLDALLVERDHKADLGTALALRVVCWLDYARVDHEEIQRMLTALGRRLGVYVHCYFAVAPPAAALLSDLIFEDYFMVRQGGFDIYNSVRTVLALFREADIIITDDILQILFPWSEDEPQAYPAISHRFEHANLADFLAVRWSFYSEQHHLIAIEPVIGREQTPEMINRSLDDLEDYLGTPIVRVVFASQNLPHTRDWQVHCLDPRLDNFPLDRAAQDGVDGKAFTDKLFDVLLDMAGELQLRPADANDKWLTPDQAHFCGALVNPASVDFVLARYDSFLVLGKPASIPYLSKQAQRLGKKLTFRFDLQCPPDGDYDCVLQTGSFGEPKTDKPVFQLMDAGWSPQARNVPREVIEACPQWVWPPDRPLTSIIR